MDRFKQLAIGIINLFEEILDQNNISIPDEFREGDEDEARIFGETYYYLEDNISEMIKKDFEIIRPLKFVEDNKNE